jgi:hypothetical protein
LSKINLGKHEFNSIFPVTSILQKCWFVFTPLQLVPIDNPDIANAKCFLKEYLTLLQIADDFQDISEDRRAPQNQNLFDTDCLLRGISAEQIQFLLAEEVLLLGVSKFKKWVRCRPKCNVTQSFAQFGQEFFSDLLSGFNDTYSEPRTLSLNYIKTGTIFYYPISKEEIKRLQDRIKEVYFANIERVIPLIRAELIHRFE